VRHILFPVDFSPRCDAFAPVVGDVARRLGARVTRIFVARPPDGLGDFAMLQRHFQTAAEGMTGALDSYRADVFDRIETGSVFRIGSPVAEIVAFARDTGPSLIMMPTHGYSPFRQLLLGSVTAGVLHDAHCPVWTEAHTTAGHPAGSGVGFKSILCAIDCGPATEALLAQAREFAEMLGGELRVVHVGASRPDFSGVEFINGGGESLASAVVGAEERHLAGLLVIGRGEAQGVPGRLRSNAHELIRNSRCPVLSI